MLKIMVVEDEKILRDYIVNSIDWHDLGFEVIGAAKDGLEALAIINEKLPDVVLTDIKMPRIDGLQLIKKLYEQYPHICTVIVSGYSDFEYAKIALKFNAKGYLTKPIDENEFILTLRRIKNEINMRNQPEKDEKVNMKEMHEIFISTVLAGNYQEDAILNTAVRLGLSGINYVAVAVINSIMVDKEIINQKGYYFLGIENYTVLIRASKTIFDINEVNELIISLINMNTMTEEIIASAGISPVEEGIASLTECFSKARKAMEFKFYMGEGKLIQYNDIKHKIKINLPDTVEAAISDYILHVNYNSFLDSKAALVSSIIFNTPDVRLLKMRLVEAFVEIHVILKNLGKNADEIFDRKSIKQEIYSLSTIKELKVWLDNISDRILNSAERCNNDIIMQVKNFIDSRQGQKINLQEIADSVHLNPSYLSTVFKKETGINLSKYMLSVKLNEAKKMLDNSDYSINMIADLLGFSDYRYFITTFKKEFNITPLKYRTSKFIK